ncbi:nucleotidyltransferase family protein [Tunicatimonas pelagia]|uniref:nucleotidyltransferase family protein n=1 Tax=Tunicatimonas pelagia TaxID=931531 RepID=UPI002665F8A5|nr:nucleotidyltransferase domain-containing protein [Tunicatimonas pelagia]WKN43789.1 nucleotidyltransferase domain-containing protein [Tunicatimonas pelagia]
MKKEQILQTLRSNKSILTDRFSIETIGIFGSMARGTHHADSDLDLVYVTQPKHTIGYGLKIELEQYLKNLLSVAKLDLVNAKYLNPIVQQAMAKDVIYV